MIPFSMPARRTGRTAAAKALDHALEAAAAAGPVTAARYLRLRREAAGLTIVQAARRMYGADEGKVGLAADLIAALETPGVRARVDLTLDRLALAFPFDADVYRQLAHDPVERHPRVCIACGCSQDDACVSADGHDTCGWSAASGAAGSVCTRCAGDTL